MAERNEEIHVNSAIRDVARQRPKERGLTLVEALIGVLIIVVIAASLLPLLTRAVAMNMEGHDYTAAANAGRASLEEFMQMPFRSDRLTVPDGQLQRVLLDYWYANPGEEPAWHTTLPADGSDPIWTRRAVVEQFSLDAQQDNGRLEDGDPAGEDDERLDGSAPADIVQLKRIQTTITSGWAEGGSSVFRPAREVELEIVKSF